MVEKPEERYPRAFAAFILAVGVVFIASIELAQWYAQTVPTSPKSLVIVGWALGAGSVLVMNRLSRWLDDRESTLARIERRLGGDA